MVDFGSWEMPLYYKPGIVEEHLATRRYGGIFDISHMGRFRITGKGALAFLQYTLTNDVLALGPGQAQYTILANETGGAVDDAFLYRFAEEDYLLVVNAANRLKDWEWLRKIAEKFRGVIMDDLTRQIGMISLQGPLSKKLLEIILQDPRAGLSDLGKNKSRKVFIGEIPVNVSRTGYTGEPLGFELFIPGEKVVEIWEKIFQEGGGVGIVPVGLGARDTLRLEAGLPLYGNELGSDANGRDIPIFALSAANVAVSFSDRKGNYIGREVLWTQMEEIRAREYGRSSGMPAFLLIKRRIRPVAVLSGGVVRRGFQVFVDDRPVGYITSGTMVPYWKFEGRGFSSPVSSEKGRRSIALAYLDADLKDGQRVRISNREKFFAGQLVQRHLRTQDSRYSRPIFVEESAGKKPGSKDPFRISVKTLVKKAGENTF